MVINFLYCIVNKGGSLLGAVICQWLQSIHLSPHRYWAKLGKAAMLK